MTKLQKYNNVIFAVFGTLGIILGLFGLFEILKQYYFENGSNNAVISTETIEKLANKNQLRQLLDLNVPIVLDTSKGLYLFPITQKTLSQPIKRNEISTDFYEKVPVSSIKPQVTLSTKLWYGNYNNLIISENCNSKFHLIFDFRISVNRVDYLNEPSHPILVISGSTDDSNKDNVLTSEDMQILFIYDINNSRLTKLTLDNYSALEYVYVAKINKLIIRYGFDLNKDGKYDYEREPTILKSYEISSDKFESVIDSTIMDKASAILVGKK
jgi:hypothetical protein